MIYTLDDQDEGICVSHIAHTKKLPQSAYRVLIVVLRWWHQLGTTKDSERDSSLMSMVKMMIMSNAVYV